MATLEPIRGVLSFEVHLNEGGTTLRRPFEDVALFSKLLQSSVPVFRIGLAIFATI